jgi:hypothetical protein
LDRPKIDSAFEPKYPVDWYNRTKADKLTSNLPQIYKELSFFQTPLGIFVKILAIGGLRMGYWLGPHPLPLSVAERGFAKTEAKIGAEVRRWYQASSPPSSRHPCLPSQRHGERDGVRLLHFIHIASAAKIP